MIYLSQRNPKWAAVKMGDTPFTVGRYGCTLTALSMATDYFKKFKGEWKSPNYLATNLKFTKGGLVIWGSLPLLLNCRLLQRVYSYSKDLLNAALKSPYRAALLQVEGFHWVIATGRNWFGNIIAVDPWTGEKITVLKQYHSITGMAILTLN